MYLLLLCSIFSLAAMGEVKQQALAVQAAKFSDGGCGICGKALRNTAAYCPSSRGRMAHKTCCAKIESAYVDVQAHIQTRVDRYHTQRRGNARHVRGRCDAVHRAHLLALQAVMKQYATIEAFEARVRSCSAAELAEEWQRVGLGASRSYINGVAYDMPCFCIDCGAHRPKVGPVDNKDLVSRYAQLRKVRTASQKTRNAARSYADFSALVYQGVGENNMPLNDAFRVVTTAVEAHVAPLTLREFVDTRGTQALRAICNTHGKPAADQFLKTLNHCQLCSAKLT